MHVYKKKLLRQKVFNVKALPVLPYPLTEFNVCFEGMNFTVGATRTFKS